MIPKKIVITGGPGTGKTAIVQKLENDGHNCFHEVIRSMTNTAKEKGDLRSFATNPIASVSNPLQFNRELLNGRITHFEQSKTINEAFVFFDRGIPDVLAYMDFYDQNYGSEFSGACKEYLYDTVFLLPMWQDIFVSDNERFESYDEALKIQRHLSETYTRYGYTVIEVPPDSVKNRVEFILARTTI